MKHDSAHIDLLISRFLTREASQAELRELESWMAQSAANKKYVEQSKFVHEQAKAYYPYKNYDTEKAWESLSSKMKESSGKSVKIKPLYTKTNFWLRVAAGFIIILGISSVFYFLQKPKAPEELLSVQAQKESVKSTLADKSEVVLNKNSTLAYAKDFGKTNRKVKLSGEAYFKVEHNTELPFVVDAGGIYIKDVGTSFNIKAYPESASIEIFVESGIVEFYSDQYKGLTLKEGQSALYNKNDSTFTMLEKSAENLLAYKTRIFRFNDTPLKEVVSELNEVYNSELRILNKDLNNCRITVTFEDENIENIVQVISETLNLQVIVDDKGFALKGNKCSNE